MSILTFVASNSGLVGFITGMVGVGVTGTLIFTADSSDPSSYLFREVEYDDNKKVKSMDGKDFWDLKVVPHSYKDLINGTTSYNNGNYVIYYGSEACPHCTGMLFGDLSLSNGNLDLKRDKMSDGAWMKAYNFTKTDEELKKQGINFIMFEDIPDSKSKKFNDDKWSLPWATNKDGSFVRDDESSKNFMKIFKESKDRFKEKVPGTPTVIIYKKGTPKVFNHDTLPGLSSMKQDDSLSNENELKKFIKYYFTKTQ